MTSSLATAAPSFAAQPPPAFLLAHLPLPRPSPSAFPLPALSLLESPSAARLPCHLIFVRYGQEIAAAARVSEDLDVEAICPTFSASWVHRGRTRSMTYPCLRSYLLARWDAADPYLWHALNDLPQVLGFAGGAIPATIPDREIDILLARVADIAITPADLRRPRPALGSVVRITSGPFAGYTGTVVRPPSHAPVVAVEISGLLSRDISVEVPISCCELIDLNATPDDRGMAQRKRKRGRRGGSPRQSSRYHLAVVD